MEYQSRQVHESQQSDLVAPFLVEYQVDQSRSEFGRRRVLHSVRNLCNEVPQSTQVAYCLPRPDDRHPGALVSAVLPQDFSHLDTFS